MSAQPSFREFPLPPFWDPARAGQVWQVLYQERAAQARAWAQQHAITPAAQDTFKLALILIDVQNTFCIPGFELFVGGRSGSGAVDDSRRLGEFIYHNLGAITQIVCTFDTHQPMQIFHPVMLVDADGNHPAPLTLISSDDVRAGRWQINPAVAQMLQLDPDYARRHLQNYTETLRQRGKYDLTIWPYHAMLGGIGHALVAAVEEAIFFHSLARYSQPVIEIKGQHPLTEHYSALGPEVTTGPDGRLLAPKSDLFLKTVTAFDAVVIAGQAKSHCVAWTVADLLAEIQAHDPALARKVYLLEDCSSPVCVPGVVDYTEAADGAYQQFAAAGMHRVNSVQPLKDWFT